MVGPNIRDNWRIVNSSNVFIGMHVVLLIITLIIAFAISRMGPVILMIVIALLIIVIPQVGLIYFRIYARSKIMRETGLGKDEAARVVNGKYYQLDTDGWPDIQELSVYLRTRGFKTVAAKRNGLYIPEHKLFINLQQVVSQNNNTSRHHRMRSTVYYFIQLGPLFPDTRTVEEQIKKELTWFLGQKGLIS